MLFRIWRTVLGIPGVSALLARIVHTPPLPVLPQLLLGVRGGCLSCLQVIRRSDARTLFGARSECPVRRVRLVLCVVAPGGLPLYQSSFVRMLGAV